MKPSSKAPPTIHPRSRRLFELTQLITHKRSRTDDDFQQGGHTELVAWKRNSPFERNTRKGRFSGPERTYMLGTVLIVLLILMLIGAFPTWPHSRSWGYYPSGGLGLVLVILVVLLLLDRI